ncbi:MAG: hypothetical protein KKA73_03370 [Chloroflexi bacterium]|nr:hypothetical protein [Chloroflexota bacterium]MBU1746704.1 hypothetical protein [Chloroflexota bacterium]
MAKRDFVATRDRRGLTAFALSYVSNLRALRGGDPGPTWGDVPDRIAQRVDFADHAAVVALFDEAFCHPDRHYTVQPVDVAVATAWLQQYTWMTNFCWGEGSKPFAQRLAEAGPLRCRQLTDLDTLYYRNRCGWRSDQGDYCCDAPLTGIEEHYVEVCPATGLRLCQAGQCPVAYQANRHDIQRLDPDLYQSDLAPYPEHEPEDWLVLSARPRYAYVPNVQVLGCEDVRR